MSWLGWALGFVAAVAIAIPLGVPGIVAFALGFGLSSAGMYIGEALGWP